MKLRGCFLVRRRSPLWWASNSCVVDETVSAREAVNEGPLLVVRDRDGVDLQFQLQARLPLQTHKFQ